MKENDGDDELDEEEEEREIRRGVEDCLVTASQMIRTRAQDLTIERTQRPSMVLSARNTR